MPTITVQLFEGRDTNKKREYAQALTAETVRVLGCKPEAVEVIFVDVKRENWASAGELWSDKN